MYDDLPSDYISPSVQKRIDLLMFLGFQQTQHKLIVTHPLTDAYGIQHDFSAIADECITQYAIKRLFDVAVVIGRNQVKDQFNSILQQETIANYK